MPTPLVLVRRPRLTQLVAAATVTVVEAAGGYGKSTLARELADALGIATVLVELGPADGDARGLLARLRLALRRAGLTDLAAAVADPSADPAELVDDLLQALSREQESVLLAIDDAHHLRDGDARDVLARLAGAIGPPHRLVLLTRQVRDPLDVVLARPGVARIRAHDLAFTDAEIEQLAGDPDVGAARLTQGTVHAIQRVSAGWPAAACLLVDELGRGPETVSILDADRPALLSRLLDDRLAGLDAHRRAVVRQLATLPVLSAALVTEITDDPGLFDALVAVGLPMTSAPGGWWHLPDPIRERLAEARPDPDFTRRASEAYRRRDEVELATRVLISAGLADDAAAVLAGLSPHAVERLDLRTIRSLVRAIPEPSLAANPRAWLHLARACDAAADGSTRSTALRLVAAAPAALVEGPLRRELDAERARDLARDGEADAAEALARRVVETATPDEELTRVRALHTLGRVRAWRAEPESLAEAERLLDDVVRLYRDLGMPGWSAHAALSLAYHVHHPRGESAAAIARLDEALGALVGRQRLRAVLLTFKAEILIASGRASEANVVDDEARTIGQALGDQRVLAYVAWNEARAASQGGHTALTLDRIAEVERHPGDWSDHATGAEFLADAAVLADRVQAREVSRQLLDRARARRAKSEQAVLIAEAVIEARSGDPVVAAAVFARLDQTSRLETRERWWLALLRAWAAARRDDPAADGLARDAFRMAAAIDPALPFIREPVIAAALEARLGPQVSAHAPRLELRLLGPTQLTRDGCIVEVPPGRTAAILEMTALAGAIAVDEVIERLWPETDPETGRARLRNTLNRLRAAIGPVVERREDTLSLTPNAGVDACRYEVGARAAIAGLKVAAPALTRRGDDPSADTAAAARAIAAGRSATARYAGTLLPSRPFDDWAAEPRERLSRLQLELLDGLAAVAEQDGDTDDAIRLRRAGISLDPDDETRYVALARLLVAQGRRGPARATLDAGVAALAALGLHPTPEMVRMRAAVGGLP